MKKFIVLLLILLINCTVVLADDILVNSKEWKDVYSGMQYGYLTENQPKFLTSERHSTLILNEIPLETSIEAFSSKKNPFVFGYESILEGKGYDAEETVFDSLSIELAKKLTDIKKFIIIDDSYGYNAIAVAPYAIASKSYVLFADEDNLNEVLRFLESIEVESILIYGHVDREVREELDKFNPEIINEDGDRFANNVEIVKKYKEINDATQVLMSNGEFIEAGIMAGAEPVLFIGTNNVPDKIKEYIQNSNIEVGVLIGNELVGTATTVRRQTGISTFVKFARSSRSPAASYTLEAISGNVTQLNIDGSTVTQAWQGYYGSVTGTITLDDSFNNTLYDWTLSNPEGEVYASESEIDFSSGNILCYNYSKTGGSYLNLSTYETNLGIGANDVDGINETFTLGTVYNSFYAGTNFINETCPETQLFNASGAKASDQFQEVLLYDDTSNKVIYSAILEEGGIRGFDNQTWDFEMIVG